MISQKNFVDHVKINSREILIIFDNFAHEYSIYQMLIASKNTYISTTKTKNDKICLHVKYLFCYFEWIKFIETKKRDWNDNYLASIFISNFHDRKIHESDKKFVFLTWSLSHVNSSNFNRIIAKVYENERCFCWTSLIVNHH